MINPKINPTIPTNPTSNLPAEDLGVGVELAVELVALPAVTVTATTEFKGKLLVLTALPVEVEEAPEEVGEETVTDERLGVPIPPELLSDPTLVAPEVGIANACKMLFGSAIVANPTAGGENL